ncbi:MAG: nucleotidyl transferase AbiEii/AbiGii toxin family protein [Bacteroidales bacterium]|nr:nucleotidyl transferase AbiEii/AbiGii toxin family protein [Bacteroidales bacterium]
MLHTETVIPTTLGLLRTFMTDPNLKALYLVGGTSLSLRLGHRMSIDLDLFSDVDFNSERMREYMEKRYAFQTDYIAESTIKGDVDNVQVDIIAHTYKWIRPCENIDGVRLASLEDVIAMKLNAIAGNGTRIKDFIDIAYLSSQFSFSQMLGFYAEKYSANTLMPLKGLTYFDDIYFDEPIRMLTVEKYSWEKIANRLIDMQRNPYTVFDHI